ncbi:hypothetical protein EDB83DRAFT_2534075 [Lactarius deliciosus]|nr:hypothetical protein EDB83DRAFT_2534075 [Lactarius deliciosus]
MAQILVRKLSAVSAIIVGTGLASGVICGVHGALARYVALLVAFVPEMPEGFLQEDDTRAFGAMTQEHYEAWRHIEASFLST